MSEPLTDHSQEQIHSTVLQSVQPQRSQIALLDDEFTPPKPQMPHAGTDPNVQPGTREFPQEFVIAHSPQPATPEQPAKAAAQPQPNQPEESTFELTEEDAADLQEFIQERRDIRKANEAAMWFDETCPEYGTAANYGKICQYAMQHGYQIDIASGRGLDLAIVQAAVNDLSAAGEFEINPNPVRMSPQVVQPVVQPGVRAPQPAQPAPSQPRVMHTGLSDRSGPAPITPESMSDIAKRIQNEPDIEKARSMMEAAMRAREQQSARRY